MLLKHFQSQGIIFGLKQMQPLVLKRRMSGWIYLCLKGNKTPRTLAKALNLEASMGAVAGYQCDHGAVLSTASKDDTARST